LADYTDYLEADTKLGRIVDVLAKLDAEALPPDGVTPSIELAHGDAAATDVSATAVGQDVDTPEGAQDGQ
jgi:hypothetical protein